MCTHKCISSGYGYQVCIVGDLLNIDRDLAGAMEWALDEIRRIQHAARSGKPIMKPRWPMLILRTPKGWSCPKELHGEFIEGSFRSHQVPLPEAKTSEEELKLLQDWLASYHPEELFVMHSSKGNSEIEGAPTMDVTEIIPAIKEKRLGFRKEAYAAFQPLTVPNWRPFGVQSGRQASCMKTVGNFLREVIKKSVPHSSVLLKLRLTPFVSNPTTFRIFSPDELVSNKLDAVFDATGRNFQWDVACRAQGGRVIEILSEHTCQGMLQGYTLTGRTGLFPTYEAFVGIIHTMMVQYSKFAKMVCIVDLSPVIG